MFYMIDKRHKKNKVVETKTHQVQLFPENYINNRLHHIIGQLKKHRIQNNYCHELENKFYNSEQILFCKIYDTSKNVDKLKIKIDDGIL